MRRILRAAWSMALLPALATLDAHAQSLDRDTLLTDAPAAPVASTVRVSGFGLGTTETNGSGSRLNGNVLWAPIEGLALDAGAYWQSGVGGGPTARARYQILSQAGVGLDLALGVRFKSVGFHPDQAEVELLLAAGRSFGDFDLVLNGAFGVETGSGGKDLEVKAFAGYRFGELRAGLDARLQSEVEDEEAEQAPKVGRDFDLTAGPAVSWLVTDGFQVQALVGVSAPRASDRVGPVGVLGASFDF